MHRLLLVAIASFIMLLPARAQQRLVLVEEFAGENCGTCAADNPAFDQFMHLNTNKALLLRYMVPIPSAGTLYYQNPGLSNARMSYYGCNFAPWGEVDGKIVGTGQYPAFITNITQAHIDSAFAIPAPFKIIVDPYFNKNRDSITISVKITANKAYSKTGSKLKMRVGLVETMHFATAPGLNGEKDFENVVRRTYPDIYGTSINNTWNNGQSQTITVKGEVPTYVNKNNEIFIAAWVQDDSNKQVHQVVQHYISGKLAVSNTSYLPGNLSLFPNPANSSSSVQFTNERTQAISVRLVDALGRPALSIPEQTYSAGSVQIDLPLRDLAPGLYYATVYFNSGTRTLPLKIMR